MSKIHLSFAVCLSPNVIFSCRLPSLWSQTLGNVVPVPGLEIFTVPSLVHDSLLVKLRYSGGATVGSVTPEEQAR